MSRFMSNEVIGYINAGGRGTRLNGLFTPDPNTGIAKALLEIGEPNVKLVDHHIANLRAQNIERIVVAAGDQRDVYEYVQDTYTDCPEIRATRSIQQLGTGGDLIQYARSEESSLPLLVQNVDTILDIDLDEFVHSFSMQKQMGALACIALTRNKGVPNEDAYCVNSTTSKVMHSAEFGDSKPSPLAITDTYRASSTGAVVLDANFVRNQAWSEQDGESSLYRNILRESQNHDKLYAYDNGFGFFRDVGTIAMWLNSQADPELQAQLRYNKP